MKLSLAPLIGDARGTTGSLTVFLSRAGLLARLNLAPGQIPTPAQLLQRGSLATISALWKTPAMAAYRLAWINLAATLPYVDVFAVTRLWTGSQLFAKFNRNLATLGLSSILPAPASVACSAPGLLTLTHNIGPPETFVVTPTNNPAAGEAVVIRSSKFLSPGITSLGNNLTIATTLPAGTAGPWDITTAFFAKHKTRPTGQQLFVHVNYVQTSTGFAGQESIDTMLW